MEHTGFCTYYRSTLDHFIILAHLAEKYSNSGGRKLFAALFDLKGTFDSVLRKLLWDKLENTSLDRKLLFLIKTLHAIAHTNCQVLYGPQD